MKSILRLTGSASAIACLLCAGTAYGQQADGGTEQQAEADSAASGGLNVIVVTAQRREQTLLEVPISITAFDAEVIEQGGWQGARDYVALTPNVFFSENDSQGGKNGDVSVRGISDLTAGSNERIIQTRPAIGFYVDDFSVASIASGSANPPLGDIERIEILRGPQTTYFGRSAAGGAINVISKKPDDVAYGKVMASYGRFDTYNLGALVNTPISDNFFARGSVFYQRSDGIVQNLSPTGNDSSYESINARLALRWRPTDSLTVDLTGQLISENEDNMARVPTGIDIRGPSTFVSGNPPSDKATCGLGADLYFPGNQRFNCEDADTYTDIQNEMVTLRVEYAGEDVTFTSITGQITGDFSQFEDLDNSGVSAFNRLNNYTSDSFSQELRLASSKPVDLGGMNFDWTVGAYYYKDKFNVDNRIITGTDLNGNFLAGFLTVPGDFPNENEQNVRREGYAIFADVALNLTDALTLSVSGRYSYDKDRQFWENTFASFDCGTRPLDANGVPAALLPGCELRPDQTVPLPIYDDGSGNLFVTGGRFAQNRFADGRASGSDFSPRVALNWQPSEDHSLYATWSRGYRPAGVRVEPGSVGRAQQDPTVDTPDNRSFFGKETVDNFEIGWKGYLADRMLLIEASAFIMNWRDMQVRIDRTLCREPDGSFSPIDAGSPDCVGLFPDNRVDNANKARSRGAELSVTARPTDGLTLGGAIGYLDAKFIDFQNSALGDVSGRQLPNAPKWSLAGTAQYDFSLSSSADAFLRLEGVHRSSTHLRFQDILRPEFPYRADAFTVFNLRAGIDMGSHSLNLVVDNLFNERYIAGIDEFSSLGPVILPHPRTYLLTYTIEFGG